MATIAPKPLFMKDVLMKIGADNYEAGLSGVTFTPSSSPVTWGGLTPTSTFSDSPSPTWTAQLDYVQDWETTGSLSQYLFDNTGKSVVAEFTPKRGLGKKFTATVTLVAGPIGGTASAFATSSVTLGSTFPVASAASAV